jgi:hypothetical protein
MGELTRSFDKATSNKLKKGYSLPGLCGAHYEIENANGTEENKTSVASVTIALAAEGGDAAAVTKKLKAAQTSVSHRH